MTNARLPTALVGSDADHGQPIDILIVDDRPANLDSLHAVLAPLGHSLVRATSGEEALRYLLDHDPAVILLDVQMPAMNGFETATMIRQRERSERTPIIFLSAVEVSSDDVFKNAPPAQSVLLKPFEPHVVRAKVKVFVNCPSNSTRCAIEQATKPRRKRSRTCCLRKRNAQVLNSIDDAVVSTVPQAVSDISTQQPTSHRVVQRRPIDRPLRKY